LSLQILSVAELLRRSRISLSSFGKISVMLRVNKVVASVQMCHACPSWRRKGRFPNRRRCGVVTIVYGLIYRGSKARYHIYTHHIIHSEINSGIYSTMEKLYHMDIDTLQKHTPNTTWHTWSVINV
jgi:hypothetical protein